MADIPKLDEATFESEVLKSTQPVVVDFTAIWCGPCKMLAPVLEVLAGEFTGKIKFAKVNVDEAPAVAGQFAITAQVTAAP